MAVTTPTFREDKAAEAVHFLLTLAGGELDIYNTVKFIYLANKTSLFSHHRSITNDKMASLPFGPVPSNTYDCLKSHAIRSAYWKSLVQARDGNAIRRANEGNEYQKLSIRDRNILAETYQEYKDFSFQQLRDVTHSFPEWRDPGESSLPISIEQLYESNDASSEAFEAFTQGAGIERALQRL